MCLLCNILNIKVLIEEMQLYLSCGMLAQQRIKPASLAWSESNSPAAPVSKKFLTSTLRS